MNILRWLLWAVCFLLRAVLIVIGWVLPPLWYDTERTKGLNIWERYVENSWRNPTPYLRGVFKQPIPEIKPNPDDLVRNDPYVWKKTRRMVDGPYIEYWSLSKIRKSKRYWEFRIGWKFVDGEETFWPTLQLGPKK
jgi:hypothetical protein